MKIMLDAGHAGKYNQSPANKSYYESEAMWKLHLLLKAALETYSNVTVATTRPTLAGDVEVYARGTSSKGYDLFLSLHSNAVGSGVNEATDYPVSIVPLNGKSDILGNKLAAEVQRLMSTSQSGRIYKREGSTAGVDYYGVIRGAVAVSCPAVVLIEHSFHTQTRATNWLLSDANLQTLANSEAAIIAAHYSLTKKGATTVGTPITGKQTLTAYELSEYLIKNNAAPKINCTPLELATLFIEEGKKLNIRGDIALCQSIHETGWFKYGGQVLPEQNNYAGIGATNNSPTGAGAWFDTPQIGVRAQIQHLFAYATKETIIVQQIVDPRFNLVTRGIAPNWEDLNGRWAVPGPTYGQTILAGFEKAVAFADKLPKPVVVPEIPPTPEPEKTAPTIVPEPEAPKGTGDNPSAWAKEATTWAKDNSIFAGDGAGNYDWQSSLTREQAAQLLYNFTKKFKL